VKAELTAGEQPFVDGRDTLIDENVLYEISPGRKF
jgi:hypothetical protein